MSSLSAGMLLKLLKSQNLPAQSQIQPPPPEPDPRRNKDYKGLCPETDRKAKKTPKVPSRGSANQR